MLPNEPVLSEDRTQWLYPDGRELFVIAGGAPDGDDGDGKDGDGDGGKDGKDGDKGGDGDGDDKDAGAKAALEAEREKARKAERRAKDADRALREAKQQLKDAEGAKLSEVEQLQKQVAELTEKQTKAEQSAQQLRVDQAVTAAARAAGAIDPDAIPRLIERDQIELDERGEPTNVGELIADLQKSKPQWFGQGGSFDGGRRGRSAGTKGDDMESLLRTAAGR